MGGTPGLDLFDDLGVQKNGTLLFYPHGPKGRSPKRAVLDPPGVPPPEGGKGRVWQTHVNLGVFLTPFGTPRGDPPMGLDPRFHCVGPYCLRWAALVPIPLSMDPTSPTEEVAVGRMIALGIGNPALARNTAGMLGCTKSWM